MKPWYEELFSNYARAYDRECFTQGTLQEVDFIEAEIAADQNLRILDIGCGTVGDFRKCPPTPDHFELLVLAEKAR